MKKYERYVRKYKENEFENTLKELLNLIEWLDTTGVGEILEEGHNLKLYDIFDNLNELGYTYDDFVYYCNVAYEDFINDVKERTQTEFEDLVSYVHLSSTFYFKISNQTAYGRGYTPIIDVIEDAYIYDEHIDNIIYSINDALEVYELMEYYQDVQTFKDYMGEE